MFKRVTAILILLSMLITGIVFADEKIGPFEITYTYGIYKIDDVSKVIYIPDAESSIFFYGMSLDAFHVMSKDGDELTDLDYYRFRNVNSITLEGNGQIVTYDVVVVEPFFYQRSNFSQFSSNANNMSFSHIDVNLTYGELLSNIRLADGVTYHYKNEKGERLGDLSNQLISDYPNVLYFEKGGLEVKAETEVLYELYFNGYKGKIIDNNYYFPLDKVTDAQDLLEQLYHENSHLKRVTFTNQHKGDLDPRNDENHLMILNDTEEISDVYFVPSNRYDFEQEKKAVKVAVSASNLGEAVVKVDKDVVSLVDGDVNRIYLHRTGTSIHDFIESIDLIEGYEWEFYDKASKKPVMDYSLPVCSFNAMNVVLTNHLKDIDVQVYFELDYKVYPDAPFKIDGHRVIHTKEGEFVTSNYISTDYYVNFYHVSNPEGVVFFVSNGPYLNLMTTHDYKRSIFPTIVKQEYIPGANYRNGRLTVFDMEDDKLVKTKEIQVVKSQIKAVFSNYGKFNKALKSQPELVENKMMIPYAEATLNDLDKAVRSIAKTEYLSFIKKWCNAFDGDAAGYLGALKHQLKLLDRLATSDKSDRKEIEMIKDKVFNTFIINAKTLDEDQVTLETIISKRARLSELWHAYNIKENKYMIINLDNEMTLTKDMVKALNGLDLVFVTDMGEETFRNEVLLALDGDAVISTDKEKTVIIKEIIKEGKD